MIRQIIDIPRPLMRATACTWDIDWGGQSAGRDTGGGDQVVFNAFPRIVGTVPTVMHGEMIGHWRALRARAGGRLNAYRVPLVDPHHEAARVADVNADWAAYLAGRYVEARPVVRCVGGAAAGADEIVVDEAGLRVPVQIGAYLSIDDWPFLVTGRSGRRGLVTLQVALLRRDIAPDAQIDVAARGVFVAVGDMMGNPSYGLDRIARPELKFSEWITRA